jgi:WD40 repeat protein
MGKPHVGSLQLLADERGGRREGHAGEIYSCAFAPDGSFVLSGGWDGHLRLWEGHGGTPVVSMRAGPKPLSCCAISPDGKQWLSGSMEGMLSIWDAVSHQPLLTFVAHTRPISAIRYAPDGQHLVTASWDRQAVLRKVGKEREGKNLAGHQDIVAGCCYSQDGNYLLTWSYDGTLRLWDTQTNLTLHCLAGHQDRVIVAAISPDGQLAASGSRDGVVKLWDLGKGLEVASVVQVAEIRGCFFLPDGQSLVTVDANGWMVLLALPDLSLQFELNTGLHVMCGDRSPAGTQVALGCEDGCVRLVNVEGFENSPLVVTPAEAIRDAPTMFGRFFGKTKQVIGYQYTCPACQKVTELGSLTSHPFPCPGCHRRLRLNNRVAQLQQI